jgi:hypothetical protein
MRKLGYILLVSGFVCVTFIAVEVGPFARAVCTMNRQKMGEHALITSEDVAVAYTHAVFRVAGFAQPSLLGGLMMLAGGIILAKSGSRDSTTNKPPVL